MRGTIHRATALVMLWSALVALAGGVGEPGLIAGVVGAALVCAWGLAHVVAARTDPAVPAVAARAHHRTLAGRAVPRQRDPDAAGHTRSRAPSVGTPAG
ncbi:DUF6412 domain-containing protein [Pseudonocardia sp. CA-107938]|uniref:DUF6412 domain-containing protein n=1 Tax=Pseudonocardia sp. CA-107938 TaxID=3240021 RepID=UPI003D8AF5EA